MYSFSNLSKSSPGLIFIFNPPFRSSPLIFYVKVKAQLARIKLFKFYIDYARFAPPVKLKIIADGEFELVNK